MAKQATQKKKNTAVYEVLVNCSKGDTVYAVGEIVSHAELRTATIPAFVIANWLDINPPVLKIKGGE